MKYCRDYILKYKFKYYRYDDISFCFNNIILSMTLYDYIRTFEVL